MWMLCDKILLYAERSTSCLGVRQCSQVDAAVYLAYTVQHLCFVWMLCVRHLFMLKRTAQVQIGVSYARPSLPDLTIWSVKALSSHRWLTKLDRECT